MPARLLRRVALAALTAFVATTAAVVVAGELPGDDARLLRWSALGTPARVVDGATDVAGIVLAATAVVAVLLRARRVPAAAAVAVAVGGILVVNPLVKRLVDRPRPGPDVGGSPLSYPSGHAAATAALGVSLALAAWGTRRLLAVAVAAAALVVVTGASQLALGLHHPSDLLGGWLEATAWTAAVWSVAAGRARSP